MSNSRLLKEKEYGKVFYDILEKTNSKSKEKFSYDKKLLYRKENNSIEKKLKDNKLSNINTYLAASVFSKLGQSIINTAEDKKKQVSTTNLIDYEKRYKKKKDIVEMSNIYPILERNIGISPVSLISGSKSKSKEKYNHNNYSKDDKQTESIEELGEVSKDKRVQKSNLEIFESFIEFEQSIDNKSNFLVTLKKLWKILENSNINTDIYEKFFNKQYIKFMKLTCVFFIYLKFIFHDFNYEASMKQAIKKIVLSFNDYLFLLIDLIVGQGYLEEDQEELKSFQEKMSKLQKSHRISKIIKPKDYITHFQKQLDMVIANLKHLSKYYFNLALFSNQDFLSQYIL